MPPPLVWSTRQWPFWVTKWLFLWATLTLVGVAFSVSYLMSRPSASWETAVNVQFMRFQIWALLVPAVMSVNGLIQRWSRHWGYQIPFHLVADFGVCLVHTVLFGFFFWILEGRGKYSLSSCYQAVAPTNIVMGLALYTKILIGDFAFEFYQKYRAEQLKSAQLEAQLAQAQLMALKMQLHPHFLFNTLNSISSLVLADARAAVHMLARLGDFLRLTLENDQMQVVSLERELEFLKCYLEIEQVRFRDRLRVTFEVEPGALTAQVPNLILQPIVENALKHGIARRVKPGRVEIQAQCKGNQLWLAVFNDSGKQPDPVVMGGSPKFGIGLSNTRERLQQFYQDDFDLDLTFHPDGGTLVTIKLPFHQVNAPEVWETVEVHKHG